MKYRIYDALAPFMFHEVTYRPILFSGSMVRAILEDRKTQTRRVITPQPDEDGLSRLIDDWRWFDTSDKTYVCRQGKPGDRLWVRETHYRWGKWVKNGLTKNGRQRWRFRAIDERVIYASTADSIGLTKITRYTVGWHKRPAIFMPRWASRITLEITGVRVERLQKISRADAVAEGTVGLPTSQSHWWPEQNYQYLWDSINGKKCPWSSNPWVWVIEFKRINP